MPCTPGGMPPTNGAQACCVAAAHTWSRVVARVHPWVAKGLPMPARWPLLKPAWHFAHTTCPGSLLLLLLPRAH